MSYILNLSLPLWWMFLPLIISLYLASKKYKWKAMYYQTLDRYGKAKSEYHKAVEVLNEKLNNSVSLTQALQCSDHLHEVTQKLYEAESVIEAIRVRSENYMSLSEMYKKQTEKDAEIIRDLNAQAVERELLIKTLRADIANENEILSERIADKNTAIEVLKKEIAELKDDNSFKDSVIQTDEATMKGLRAEVNQLKSEIQWLDERNEKLYNLVMANSRTRKAWEKINKSQNIAVQNLQQQTEVVHDILGVPRIVKADQSENDNGRHDVLSICDEVNRGVKEQVEAIKKELASVVDMSQIEVGDSVVNRNGEKWLIIAFDYNERDVDYPAWIELDFGKYTNSCRYTKDGYYWIDKRYCVDDIIQIIKQPKCYKSNNPCQFNCNGLCKNS